MKPRFFFPVNVVQNEAAHEDSDCTEPGKNNGKRQADLSHQLKGQPRVIPDIPVQNAVDNDSCNKFAGGHKCDAPEHLLPQRRRPVRPYALLGTENQADPSQQKHGPVGESAENHLEPVVDRAAQCAQKQVLANLSHKKRPLLSMMWRTDVSQETLQCAVL